VQYSVFEPDVMVFWMSGLTTPIAAAVVGANKAVADNEVLENVTRGHTLHLETRDSSDVIGAVVVVQVQDHVELAPCREWVV
jgi:hypothetical protein